MRKMRSWRIFCSVSLVALLLGLIPLGTPATQATPAQQGQIPSWFFAEGSTNAPFDTWFLVLNPNSVAANVTFNFFPAGGGTPVVRKFVVNPTSRFSLEANQILPPMGFSTRIDFDQMVYAERAMYVSYDGSVVAGGLPGKVWNYAEGSTNDPFQTWLLLFNPNNQVATGSITYFIVGGSPVVQNFSLPPNSRTSIFANAVVPNAGFSILVGADSPILVERSMYRFPGNAATGVLNDNAASLKWFFADGDSRSGRDTWLLLSNPNGAPVNVSVSLLNEAGSIVHFVQPIGGLSRVSLFLNQFMPNDSFAISLEADSPVVAERSMFGPAAEPRWAHSTQGAVAEAFAWHFAEGSTAQPFDEIITVLNTNIEPITFLRFEFFMPNGSVVTRELSIGPLRKFSLRVSDVVPNAGVAARVSGSRPIVVERTMFINKDHVGATNTVGVKFPLF